MTSSDTPWKAVADALVLSRAHRAAELARPWLLLAAYVVACAERWWWLAPWLALACFLAGFVQLIRAAAWGARGWTAVLNSLAYHDLHHRFARVPTSLLPALAARMGPDEAFADETITRPRTNDEHA